MMLRSRISIICFALVIRILIISTKHTKFFSSGKRTSSTFLLFPWGHDRIFVYLKLRYFINVETGPSLLCPLPSWSFCFNHVLLNSLKSSLSGPQPFKFFLIFSHLSLFILLVGSFDILVVLFFHMVDHDRKKLWFFCKRLFVNNRRSFINSITIFHVIPNNWRLCKMLLLDEWLDNQIVIPPISGHIWHEGLWRVINFDCWPIFYFRNDLQNVSRA